MIDMMMRTPLLAPDGFELNCRLISPRYGLTQRRAIIPLNECQNRAIEEFLCQLKNFNYRVVWHPCICDSRRFSKIAEYDRYGIPVNTVICDHCGQVQSNPFLDDSSTAKFYRHLYRSIYSGSLKADKRHFNEQMEQGARINRFFKSHGFVPGHKIFEIGCGAGGILSTLNTGNREVYGCDYNDTYLHYGRKYGLNLLAGDASILKPFAKADLIILSHVIEHFLDPVRELKKIDSLLTANGYLFIEVPNIKRLNTFYYFDLLRFFQNAHNWHFSPLSLDRLMALCGYRRIFGNSKIRAVYQKGNDRSIPIMKDDARRQWIICRRHEILRPFLSPLIKLADNLSLTKKLSKLIR